MIQVWKEGRKERKKIAWCMVPVDAMVVSGGGSGFLSFRFWGGVLRCVDIVPSTE